MVAHRPRRRVRNHVAESSQRSVVDFTPGVCADLALLLVDGASVTAPAKRRARLTRELTEREIQNLVVKLYRRCGCKVYPTSQYRISRQALGLPDLYVVHPAAGDWWHEVKTPHGKQSKEQAEFQAVVEGTGLAYVLGGVSAAQEILERRQIIAAQFKPL